MHRLLEFGRDPKVLTYIPSRTVKYCDRVERRLSDELDVTIIIRDGNYTVLHINDYPGTRPAYDVYLRPYTEFLSKVGASTLISPSRHVQSPAVYVFLASEIERRGGTRPWSTP